jgi:hypothetical protein
MPVTTPSLVVEAERRAWRYWFDDGLPNLVFGIAFLAMAIYLHLEHHPAGPLGVAEAMFFMLFYLVIVVGQKRIIEWLKAKITYPRTGYVAPPFVKKEETAGLEVVALLDSWKNKRPETALSVRKGLSHSTRLTVVTSLMVAAVCILFIDSPWICVAAGIMWAVAFWLGNRENWRPSWLVLIGLPLIGFLLAVRPVERFDRVAYFLGGGGVLYVLDGAISLIRYIRRNPVAQP